MPWSTALVVFGAWVALLTLTLLHFFVWSKKRDDHE